MKNMIGFYWIIPDLIAGFPMPGLFNALEEDLITLKEKGITTIVNLTETPHDKGTLSKHGFKSLYLRIENNQAPSIEEADELIKQIITHLENNEKIAVHCMAGLGRTGTILGAWLMKQKHLTAKQALKSLRLINPLYVQSKQQETFLDDWEIYLSI